MGRNTSDGNWDSKSVANPSTLWKTWQNKCGCTTLRSDEQELRYRLLAIATGCVNHPSKASGRASGGKLKSPRSSCTHWLRYCNLIGTLLSVCLSQRSNRNLNPGLESGLNPNPNPGLKLQFMVESLRRQLMTVARTFLRFKHEYQTSNVKCAEDEKKKHSGAFFKIIVNSLIRCLRVQRLLLCMLRKSSMTKEGRASQEPPVLGFRLRRTWNRLVGFSILLSREFGSKPSTQDCVERHVIVFNLGETYDSCLSSTSMNIVDHWSLRHIMVKLRLIFEVRQNCKGPSPWPQRGSTSCHWGSLKSSLGAS